MSTNRQYRDSTPTLKDFNRGERPTAAKFNNSVQTLRSLTQGVAPPKQIFQAAGGTGTAAVGRGVRLELLEYGWAADVDLDPTSPDIVRGSYHDHIICRRKQVETVDDEEVTTWTSVMVAKPVHLTEREASKARRLDHRVDNVFVTIEYVDEEGASTVLGDTRTARNTVTDDEEFQRITPAYALGEAILVGHVGTAATGVVVSGTHDPDRPGPYGWIDENGDGSPVALKLLDMSTHRDWCHPPEETERPDL